MVALSSGLEQKSLNTQGMDLKLKPVGVFALMGFGSDPEFQKTGLCADWFRCKMPKVKIHLKDSWVKTMLLNFQTWTLQIIKPKLKVLCGRGQSPMKDVWLWP